MKKIVVFSLAVGLATTGVCAEVKNVPTPVPGLALPPPSAGFLKPASNELTACAGLNEGLANGKRRRALQSGDINIRAFAIERLEYRTLALAVSQDSAQVFGGVECDYVTLRHFYSARARRQHILMDVEGQVGAFSLGMSALSFKAGAATQNYWAAGGLVPVLLSEFNANEPVRDLYHAGGDILDFTSYRYRQLWTQSRNLEALNLADVTNLDAACQNVRDMVLNEVSHWPEANADRTLVMGEAARIVTACNTVRQQVTAFRNFKRGVTAQIGAQTLSQAYARDLIALDHQLLVQDRGLNYTPYETVKSLLASPFFFIGSLLSNEDAKGAINTISADRAIKGMEINVTGVPLLPGKLPETFARLDPVKPEVKGRVTVKVAYEKKNADGKTVKLKSDMGQVVVTLESAVGAINTYAEDLDYAVHLSKQIFTLSRSGKIKVATNPAANKVEILFEPAT